MQISVSSQLEPQMSICEICISDFLARKFGTSMFEGFNIYIYYTHTVYVYKTPIIISCMTLTYIYAKLQSGQVALLAAGVDLSVGSWRPHWPDMWKTTVISSCSRFLEDSDALSDKLRSFNAIHS